jgi:2-polyprenyl-3-methyl-5-hydroxy-6-metoxy-1,4-benzoquinol methylase
MGHLNRCLKAAASFSGSVYYGADPELTDGRPVFEAPLVEALAAQAGVVLLRAWPAGLRVPTVVADLQATPQAAYRFLRERCDRLVGWDEGGPVRDRFPYLVDSLPHDARPAPNVRLPGLLGLKISAVPPEFLRPIRSVLAVFGGADPAGLTLRFLKFVDALRAQGRWPYELTVVRGPLSRFIAPPGTRVLDAPSDLPGLMGTFDLVVTSWGLTALESLASGTPVVILNPTAYHERLTRAARLPSFGVGRPRPFAFWEAVDQAPAAARRAFAELLRAPLAAGTYFAADTGSDGRCPVCHTGGHRVLARTEHKSYHRCAACGMEYLSTHRLPEKQYSEAYFFEDYQKQYGKTYLDDFDHIQDLGRQRLAFLDRVFGTRPGRRILDAGCAYGPFLAAAAEAGHRPFGLDVAEPAVDHVRGLGFPAVKASFPEFKWSEGFPGEHLPDVLSLWYVIEHFPDLDAVLRRANTLLPVGGVLAFSTPNARGVTRLFRPEKFWRESPDDHFSLWSPRNTRAVLRRFGFEVRAFRITGQHPERFPGAESGGWKLAVVAALGRWLGWGDTFEVYARKTKELS